MDIGKSFTYVFDDDKWITKILIAAVILLLGVVFIWLLAIPTIVAGLLLGGYGIEITRRVLKGDPQVLPEWENWEKLLVDGVKAFIIGLVYALPMILVSLCMSTPAAVLAEDAEELSVFLSSVSGCLNFLWGIVMAFFLPAATARFVAQDDLAAAFRFGEVFALIRDNFVTYLLVAVIAFVADLIGGLGFLVCGIGWLFTIPFAGWVSSWLYGAAYLEATGQGQVPALEEVA